jgi:tetratricopeptide (TPR) repeat protein
VRKELIEPDRSDYAQQDGFRFRHALIRDAAYDGIPKEVRAELHARFADWMQRNPRDGATELEEIRGYHLEQAYRLRQQLGPLDEGARELARSAAALLGSAGRRAFARGDMPAAVTLMERTHALLPADDPVALALLPDLGLALKESGELVRAEEVLTDAIAAAVAAGDKRVELNALIERASLRLLSDPEGQTEELLELVEDAIPTLTELGDDRALATAWSLIALTRGLWHGRFATGEDALERALEHARRAGDRRQEGAILGWLAFAALSGPTPVPEAIRHCESLLEESKGDHLVEAGALRSLSTLEAKRGRFDEARELIGRARRIYENLGMPLTAVAATTFACGHLELLADDHAAAERQLRRGYDEFERMGEKGYLSSVAALLAEALYGQGRYAEAERFTQTSEAAAASDDISAQIHLRATRAKLLAHRDGSDVAVDLAREAVSLAATTDALDMQGDALLDLAHVLRICGRDSEATPCVRDALALYERKGNVVSAEKARALLDTAVEV